MARSRKTESSAGLSVLPKSMASKIELVPTASLKPFDRRARTHSAEQMALIEGSFSAFGVLNPLLVDDTQTILCGHARWEAAKRLGYPELPVVKVGHLSPDERRAYVIADNAIAMKAGWDLSILAAELDYLSTADLSFDVGIIGFTVGEIDVVIADAEKAAAENEEDDDVEPRDGPAVTKPGDLWLIGPHRLLCGDSLDPAVHSVLMNGTKGRMVLTDPPYNVGISGFARARSVHREFAMASGEMAEPEFTSFLTQTSKHAADDLVDGGLLYIFMDHRHLFELQTAARANKLSQINLCVWDKLSGGMGSFYRSRHELCVVFKVGAAPHLNMIELGKHGRDRHNVWQHRGLNSFGRGRDDDLKAHPTVKPWPLLAEAIKDCTRRRDIVVDPFAGSGSTLIAAAKTGRRGFGIELDPLYVDTALGRLMRLAELPVTLAETGQSFAEVKAERLQSQKRTVRAVQSGDNSLTEAGDVDA